jgi:hypothetical protein
LAETPTAGIGDCRKARNSDAAPSTSSRRGAWAATSSPAAIPAIDACKPDSTVHNHSATTTTAYADARQTPRWLIKASRRRQAPAPSNGHVWRWSE